MGYATAADLLAELRALRLLEPSQLDQAARIDAPAADPKALASQLVERQWLTPLQASVLLQGRGTELVLGSYVILARLGEGGMGQVFKARHAKLGHIVALKVIRKDRLSNPAAVQRFESELHLACQVEHSNLVRAFDADQVAGTMYLAMEYVDGIDLGKLVAGSGPLPVAEACEYVRQTAAGLAACHERGLIHRDIKPSNLLLTRRTALPSRPDGSGEPSYGPSPALIKILDLGLARMDSGETEQRPRLTQLGKAVGTADYMSPEQARDSRAVDGRADLYSLGCTLYFLLAGKAPFSGLTRAEKLVSHQIEEAPRLERVRPDVPPELAAVVRKLLAKHPDDRYQTAQEVIEALEPFVAPATPAASERPAPSVATPAAQELVVRLSRAGPTAQESRPTTVWSAAVAYAGPLIQPAQRLPARSGGKRTLIVAASVSGVLLTGLVLTLLALAHPGPEEPPSATVPPRPAPAPSERKTAVSLPELLAIPAARQVLAPPLELVAVVGEQRRCHWGSLQCVAASADGRFVASGGHDNAVRIWDAATGRERAAFGVLGNGVAALMFRPDGKLLAVSQVANKPPDLREWDPASGKTQTLDLSGSAGGHAAELAADGRTLVLTLWDRQGAKTLGAVEVRDLPGGSLRKVLEDNAPVNGVAASRDGKVVAAATGKVVKIWDVLTSRIRATTAALDAPVSCLAVSPDGARIASASTQWSRAGGGEVKLWESATGDLAASLRVADPVASLAFSPVGNLLAVGTGQAEIGRIVLFELPAAKQRSVLQGHGGPVMCLAFGADGETLISGSSDHTVRLWDPVSGKERDALQRQHGPAAAVTFAPDSHSLAVLSGPWEPRVRLHDLTTGQERDLSTGHRGGIVALRFTDRGAKLAAWGPWGATAWDTATAQVAARLRAPGDARVWGDLAPDGKTIAIAGNKDPSVQLWNALGSSDPPSAPRLTLPGPKSALTALAFAPDGKMLATVGGDREIRLWNLADSTQNATSSRRSLAGHAASPVALAFTSDSRLVASASRDGIVKLWDADSGQERATFTNPANLIGSLAFSPDGKYLAVWSMHGVKLWDIARGQERSTLPKPASFLRAVAFSPESGRIATADQDGNVCVRRTASAEKLLTWQLPGVVYQLGFAPDGRLLATANGNGTAFVLRVGSASNTVADASR